jgi:chaperonin GroES
MEDEDLIDETEAPEDLTLEAILDADNIADMLDDAKLNEIGGRCIRDYEIDERSRADWLARYRKWLDVAMQVRETKTFPWKNAANIKYPLLTTAAVQFQARAYPAIVDGSMLVKGKVLGPDPDGRKRERANRIAAHMTYQLLQEMPGWEEDTDRMLISLPIVGCVVRKSWYDPVRKTNRCEAVSGEHFSINYWAKSLESAPHYTHIRPLYPHEIREYVLAGLWRETPVEQESGEDEQGIVDMLEQHCRIDLDGDGYPEPYVVTMTRRGDVASILPCFGAEDVTLKEDGTVIRIERRSYFSKYGFIPSPDGSFYDIGFGALLEDLSAAIDATINQMIDAGTLANTQGGFIGSGINIKGGVKGFAPGEWKRIDVTGGTLRENIVPLNMPGPSAVLFNLLGMMIEAAKGITSVQDIMTGAEQSANTPATTTLARIEQGMKVMTGIFKRIHRAFGQDLQNLYRLNADFLDDEVYAELNDTPMQVGRADYQGKDIDVRPVSDPSMASDAQKLARAEVLMSQHGNPLLDPAEITRRFLEAASVPDTQSLFKQQAGPGVEATIAMEQQVDNRLKTQAEIRAKDAAAAADLAKAAQTLQQIGLNSDAADIAASAIAMAARLQEGEGNEREGQPADGPGPVQPMVGEQGDEGIPGLSGPPPIEPDGGMGAGPMPDAGSADGGLPVQPDIGPDA